MKKSITREVEVEVCNQCGDELFEYDHRGEPPRHVYGVRWGGDDEAYCSNRCFDKAHAEV